MKKAFLNSTRYALDRFDSFSLTPNFLLFLELDETSLILRTILTFPHSSLLQFLEEAL